MARVFSAFDRTLRRRIAIKVLAPELAATISVERFQREIKPDNVLLSGGTAAVTDFGVAKALDVARDRVAAGSPVTITREGVAVGTPAYMAPEQAAGDPAMDYRVDLYAIGILAYEML